MFSNSLQEKIDQVKSQQSPITLGNISLENPLILAPMASICNAPFRLIMEELGAGLTVSELISCHGINHGNIKTQNMLKILKGERNVGIQIFGEDAKSMAECVGEVQKHNPKFIDINMGCPVKKVVGKGGGSALLKEPKKLFPFLNTIKKELEIPLTIKIRTGWDNDSINADEIISVAHDAGVEFVAIHGRTRAQAYKGLADWNYLEKVANDSLLPIIGNGDLHYYTLVKERMKITHCKGLMIARGALRNPFIFLESMSEEKLEFSNYDYLEVLNRLKYLIENHFDYEPIQLIQLRKHILWFASGYKGASSFRSELFKFKSYSDMYKSAEDFFSHPNIGQKQIDYSQSFMTSGHG